MDLVVGRDVGGPASLEPGDRFLRRQGQMLGHLGLQPCERPVGIDARQERRDVVRVAPPARLRVGELGLVAGLGGRDHVGSDQDVLAQLGGQLVPGRLAVERLDGVADVRLVLQQAADGRRRVRRAARQADDREARPGDVVLPEHAHVAAESRLGGRDSSLRMGRRVAVCMGVMAVRDREGGQGGEERHQHRQRQGDRA